MADIRMVVLGPSRVGKTSIIRRFLFNEFKDRYKETLEHLYIKEISINGVKMKVDIMDTAGRVEFPAMRQLYITTASAFLFVYTLEGVRGAEEAGMTRRGHRPENFGEIKDCYEEVKGIRGSLKGIPIIFVGNKMDLLPGGDRGSIGSSTGSPELSASAASPAHHGSITLDWIEDIEDLHISSTTCSAKRNENIEQIFTSFLHLYKQISDGDTSSLRRRSSSKSTKNTLDTEEPKSRRSRSLIRRSSKKVKKQVEFIEPQCRIV